MFTNNIQRILETKSEDDYRKALSRVIKLCESQKADEDLKEQLIKTVLVEKYEGLTTESVNFVCTASFVLHPFYFQSL